jgi:hypothetical protein
MTPYSRGRGQHWISDIAPFLIGVVLAIAMLVLYFSPSRSADPAGADTNAGPSTKTMAPAPTMAPPAPPSNPPAITPAPEEPLVDPSPAPSPDPRPTQQPIQ